MLEETSPPGEPHLASPRFEETHAAAQFIHCYFEILVHNSFNGGLHFAEIEVTMVNEATIAAFRAALRGGFIEPADPNYDAARKVYNGMIDRRPRLIARCADVADVMAAVNFGREQKLLVAIRGGGHNAGGLGSVR